MTSQPLGVEELGHAEALPESEEAYYDDENDTTNEFEDSSVSRVACDRCRRRKIKCNRRNPCNQCLRASHQCSFPQPQNRVKRQRVLISSLYESRIEHITQKIDDLVHLMQQLDIPPNDKPAQPGGKEVELYETTNPVRQSQSRGIDHEGVDKSLLVNALQVAKSLETALDHSTNEHNSQANMDIRLARQTLQAVLDTQGRPGISLDGGPPFERSLPHGMTFKDLPFPPTEKVMACLRMMQDRDVMTVPWLGEMKSFGDFTLILVKVCSPGPVTDVELIISLSGLYWVFTECARWASPEGSNDLKDQARICQNSLEVILSTLNFWLPTTVDATLAMNLAGLFCFQKGKLYACWTFINKATMLAVELGLHMADSSPGLASEEQHRRHCLFWSVYCLERSIALKLSRPSVLRDQHVTIPKPNEFPPIQGLTSSRQSLIDGVEMSRIFGHVYDDLFSPSAWELPTTYRTTRCQVIKQEWLALIASKDLHMAQWEADPRGTMGEIMPIDFAQHATRATDYLFLMVIHRIAISPSSTSPSPECTAAARISLREHTTCITLLTSYGNGSAMFELWTNGGQILLPFLPFSIVFYSSIETGNPADLEGLKTLVDSLELLSRKPDYTSCAKQLRIFRALYTVATIYNEIRGQSYHRAHSSAAMLGTSMHTVLDGFTVQARQSPRTDDNETSSAILDLPPEPYIPESQPWVDFGGMDLDPLGTQLGYWIQESSQEFDYFGKT